MSREVGVSTRSFGSLGGWTRVEEGVHPRFLRCSVYRPRERFRTFSVLYLYRPPRVLTSLTNNVKKLETGLGMGGSWDRSSLFDGNTRSCYDSDNRTRVWCNTDHTRTDTGPPYGVSGLQRHADSLKTEKPHWSCSVVPLSVLHSQTTHRPWQQSKITSIDDKHNNYEGELSVPLTLNPCHSVNQYVGPPMTPQGPTCGHRLLAK